MTRYEYAMQQAGDAATENYLRDLKASHDIMFAELTHAKLVAVRREYSERYDAALKAAEGLK